jgi:hypothetical protein
MNPPVTPMNFFGGMGRSRRNHQQGSMPQSILYEIGERV